MSGRFPERGKQGAEGTVAVVCGVSSCSDDCRFFFGGRFFFVRRWLLFGEVLGEIVLDVSTIFEISFDVAMQSRFAADMTCEGTNEP
jgi:hypothetical protein